MKIQELKSNGTPRDVPAREVSKEFFDKLMSSKVGKKRFKEVKPPRKEDKNK